MISPIAAMVPIVLLLLLTPTTILGADPHAIEHEEVDIPDKTILEMIKVSAAWLVHRRSSSKKLNSACQS